MMTIHKYKLKPGENRISMPVSAVVLHAHTQGGCPHIWVRVDTEETTVSERLFYCSGTGHEIPEKFIGGYIGTCHDVLNAGLVYHVCEEW